MNMRKGKVWLIGAGPGDLELLTLKAVRALGEADVLLMDELVNPLILRFTKPECRLLSVGKRGGCRSTPQAFIEGKLKQLALQGFTVARVKGGDPFVFGRGGEELRALQEAGIAVEVVNGITAGIGVPAAVGIPVTDREFSRGVTFITAHEAATDSIQWQALVKSGMTLVFYMGLTNLRAIAEGLLQAGCPADKPTAVIQNGTLPNQRLVIDGLGAIVQAVKKAEIKSPALVVVGEVVRCAQVEKMSDKQPNVEQDSFRRQA